MHEWPDWWNFEIILSPHVIERMLDRDFSEVELRAMLEDAEGYRPSVMHGRYLITTHLADAPWEVVVEPDHLESALTLVTAYRVE
ncbi:MAG: DUF4258 domain-containing protein [Planctomycetes bacterium]|nr:DUF4258 domain-containing protein [Planctomycetota bacterium]